MQFDTKELQVNLFSHVDVVVQMRNVPFHSFMCLNAWLPAGDIVWEGYEYVGGGACLEKVHNWRLALKAYSIGLFQVLSFCFLVVVAVLSVVSGS